MNAIIGKSVTECFEGDLASRLSMFTNIGICVGITLAMNLGFLLPAVDSDRETLAADEGWRIIYLMPAILAVIELLLYLTVVREEPITYSIMNYQDQAAMRMMTKIFKIDAENEEEKEELLKVRIGQKKRTTSMDASTMTFMGAVFGPKYRKASWICFFINSFYQ